MLLVQNLAKFCHVQDKGADEVAKDLDHILQTSRAINKNGTDHTLEDVA